MIGCFGKEPFPVGVHAYFSLVADPIYMCQQPDTLKPPPTYVYVQTDDAVGRANLLVHHIQVDQRDYIVSYTTTVGWKSSRTFPGI